MKLLFATFLLVCLVLSSSFFEATMAGSSFVTKVQAEVLKGCSTDRCLKYCGICCESASACHLGLMETRMNALATGTSRTPRARPSALEMISFDHFLVVGF
ncbi:snakin-1 [Fagus crenata]